MKRKPPKRRYAVVSVLIPEKSYNKLVEKSRKSPKKMIAEKMAGNMLVKAINAKEHPKPELVRGGKEDRVCVCGCGQIFTVGFAQRHKRFFNAQCASVFNAAIRKSTPSSPKKVQQHSGKGRSARIGGVDVI